MKKLFILAALGVSLGLVHAAENAQQTKMATCNREAGDKKGDERKSFMKECLSTKKLTPQQEKMKSCNAEAAGKKGDERKKFMSECLKK